MLDRDTGMYFRLCCCSLYELALDDDGGGRGPRSSWVGCCKRYRRSPWAAVGVIVETRKVDVMPICWWYVVFHILYENSARPYSRGPNRTEAGRNR